MNIETFIYNQFDNYMYMYVLFCFIHPNPVIKDYSYLSHQIHSDMWAGANQTIKSNSSPWDVDWSKINWPHGCLKAQEKTTPWSVSGFPT